MIKVIMIVCFPRLIMLIRVFTLEKFRRYETSTIYMGPQAPQFIREVIGELAERVIEDV